MGHTHKYFLFSMKWFAVALIAVALASPLPERIQWDNEIDDYDDRGNDCQAPTLEPDYVPLPESQPCDGGCDGGCDDGGCDSDNGCDDGGCDSGCDDGGCDSGCDDGGCDPEPVYTSDCDVNNFDNYNGCDNGCGNGCGGEEEATPEPTQEPTPEPMFDTGCGDSDSGCDNSAPPAPTTEAPECNEPVTTPASDCGADGDAGALEAVPKLNQAFQMGMIDEDVEIKRFENFDGEYDNPD